MNFFLAKRILTHNQLKTEKIISFKYGFIYLTIPKSASRSIISVLHRDKNCLETSEKYCKLMNLLKNKEFYGFYKFAFVRNPWDRIVSTYLNKIKNHKEENYKNIVKYYKGLDHKMNFGEFVNFLYGREGGDLIADRHWLSQYKFISDKHGKIVINFVGRYESLQKDFDHCCERIGIPKIELPFLNTREGWKPEVNDFSRKHDPLYYRSFYDNRTREMMRKRYIKDIELFNYEF